MALSRFILYNMQKACQNVDEFKFREFLTHHFVFV